jgi:hypothetical protein
MSFIVIFAIKSIFLILIPNINNFKKVLKICSYQTCKQLFNISAFGKSLQTKVLYPKALHPTAIPNMLLGSFQAQLMSIRLVKKLKALLRV